MPNLNKLTDNLEWVSPTILDKSKLVGSTAYLGSFSIPIATITITNCVDFEEENYKGFYGYTPIAEIEGGAMFLVGCITESTDEEEYPIGTYFKSCTTTLYTTGVSCATDLATVEQYDYIDEKLIPKLIIDDTAEIAKLAFDYMGYDMTFQEYINDICTEFPELTPITLTDNMITTSGLTHEECLDIVRRGEPLNVYIRTFSGKIFENMPKNIANGEPYSGAIVNMTKPIRVQAHWDGMDKENSDGLSFIYHPAASPLPDVIGPTKTFAIGWNYAGKLTFSTTYASDENLKVETPVVVLDASSVVVSSGKITITLNYTLKNYLNKNKYETICIGIGSKDTLMYINRTLCGINNDTTHAYFTFALPEIVSIENTADLIQSLSQNANSTDAILSYYGGLYSEGDNTLVLFGTTYTESGRIVKSVTSTSLAAPITVVNDHTLKISSTTVDIPQATSTSVPIYTAAYIPS